jgi:Adenylate and Guanylate cyclase catalytic domain
VPNDRRIEFRMGINVGDIVVEDGDIFGDGVKVAARLEALAEPGGVCVSARVQEDAAGKLDLAFEDGRTGAQEHHKARTASFDWGTLSDRFGTPMVVLASTFGPDRTLSDAYCNYFCSLSAH